MDLNVRVGVNFARIDVNFKRSNFDHGIRLTWYRKRRLPSYFAGDKLSGYDMFSSALGPYDDIEDI